MGLVTIEDLDAAALEQLQARAQRSGRTVEDEARRVLESALASDAVALKPSERLAARLGDVRDAVSRYRLSNPRLFGSALTGQDRPDSDLDILVDAEPGASLFDLGGLRQELEEMLGVGVDLRTPQDLPPAIRAEVLAEAEPL
ncbi:nucleotidyltransferase family protein [Rhizobium sp. G21]|uniref:nucleotidyltransferase family protein n=1 Tax=Rhizobium sp. G21 TaxID=2758439 RepID=UPI001603F8BB|nr:nucleotidyltransferase domain-containing protein [Rhizobium sp. G21]